jgi:hypothetical protein
VSNKLKAFILSVPHEVRDAFIRQHTGSPLAYIAKRVYLTPPDELPTFKMKIAVGLDKASRGQLDFRQLIEGGNEIDWEFVKRRLNSKKERLTEKEAVE